MTLAFTPPRAIAAPAPSLGAAATSALVLTIAAFLIRLPHFGDPAFMIDEQFYLLVGERVAHGALPFVDIWDRKPVGLFLLYAACARFGDGVLAYQTVATLFAAATAWTIARIARRPAGDIAAGFAGLLYLIWIEIAEGGGGQAPIFYNLPMALAGCAALRAGEARSPERFARRAFAAMALVGAALQIKYTVLAEGVGFGLILAGWTLTRLPPRAAAIRIVLLAGTALAPTLAVFTFYAALGHAHAFWFANFVSIFGRAPTPPAEIAYRTGMIALRLLPFVICIVASQVYLGNDRTPSIQRWRLVVLSWCASALIGLFTVGTLYSHYILPAFVPFAVASAPIFARRTSGPVLAIFAAALPALTLGWPDFERTWRHQRELAAMAALVPAAVDRECMEMFDGPPALYRLTHACFATRFPFPDHLSAAAEAQAIGVDPAAELGRLLARRPLAITIADDDVREPNKATFAILRAALVRDYRLRGIAPHDGRDMQIWVRH